MKEPEIRFKGFEGEWNSISLSDHDFIIIAGGDIDKKMLKKNGLYPVIANAITNDGIVGYYDNYFRIEAPSVTVTGRGDVGFAQSRKYNYTPVVRLLSIKSSHDVDFLSNSINRKTIIKESTGVPQLTTIQLSKIELNFPSDRIEEHEIGLFIDIINKVIQTTSKKLAFLKQIKAASLQSMFPQEGETRPRVRFKGFDGEWKEERLLNLFIERHDISTITDSLPQLSFTISEGVIYPEDRKSNKRDFLIRDIVNKKYLITYVGDIIYNPANVVYGAIHRNSLCNGVVSPIYKIFKTEQDSNFMECIVRNPLFISRLSMKTEGTVTKLKTLKPESFLEMIVVIAPSIQEQQKIGNFFRNLDRQITLQTRRLEKLKQIKAACLDKMFV